MKAIWRDQLIAESDDTIVVEGNHYFPRECVDSALLRTSKTTSNCPWKGTANYFTVVVDGEKNKDAAWYYTDPKEAALNIKNKIAFWKGITIIE